jgi:hypothetical protein
MVLKKDVHPFFILIIDNASTYMYNSQYYFEGRGIKMNKKYKLVNDQNMKSNIIDNPVDIKLEEKEMLINMLKRARNIIGAITIGMTCGGVSSTNRVVREVISNKEALSMYAKDEVNLILCIASLWFILYKVNSELKNERNKYIDIALENAFANMREEMHIEHTSQKTL